MGANELNETEEKMFDRAEKLANELWEKKDKCSFQWFVERIGWEYIHLLRVHKAGCASKKEKINV